MRILKFKIAQAAKKHQLQEEDIVCNNIPAPVVEQNLPEPTPRQLRTRSAQPSLPRAKIFDGSTSCKNVMKNYSRAFIIFALSQMVLPYLMPLLQQQKLELSTFKEFVKSQKKAANCIKGLRDGLLLVMNNDSDQVIVMKKVFQKMCVVFLKFFCVNWIFHSKVMDKTAHLSYRQKLLRRVQNPAAFTYLEDINQ